MNANELADELDIHVSMGGSKFFKESATMLRQQQSEIEALKAEIVSIEKNTDYWADKANWIKNNEPVAWMRESDKAVCSNEEKLWFIEEEGSDWNYVIPLYTHQYERPHNTVLVPCDKLAEIQAEIEALKLGDRQCSPAMDLAKIEIADLKAEIKALKERFCAYEYDDDEPPKETRPFTPEEVDCLRKWAMEGDLKNAKTLLEKSGYKVKEPNQ